MNMSEKRFTSGFGFNKDYDNPIRFITDEKTGKDYVLFAEITDLLNSLNDENKQLKRDEQLYAKEILRLKEELKEKEIVKLGGDY